MGRFASRQVKRTETRRSHNAVLHLALLSGDGIGCASQVSFFEPLSRRLRVALALSSSQCTSFAQPNRLEMASFPNDIWRVIMEMDAGDDDEADDWMFRRNRLLEMCQIEVTASVVAQAMLNRSPVIRTPAQHDRFIAAFASGRLEPKRVQVLTFEAAVDDDWVWTSEINGRRIGDVLARCDRMKKLRLAFGDVYGFFLLKAFDLSRWSYGTVRVRLQNSSAA